MNTSQSFLVNTSMVQRTKKEIWVLGKWGFGFFEIEYLLKFAKILQTIALINVYNYSLSWLKCNVNSAVINQLLGCHYWQEIFVYSCQR